MASVASRQSSQICRDFSKGRWKAWYSSGEAPRPVPNSTRPPLSTSSVATRSAVRIGRLERQQHHAEPEVDPLGPLGDRGQHQVRRGGVGEPPGEVVLDEPGGVEAQPVAQHDLVDHVLERPLLDLAGAPAHLQFVAQADP